MEYSEVGDRGQWLYIYKYIVFLLRYFLLRTMQIEIYLHLHHPRIRVFSNLKSFHPNLNFSMNATVSSLPAIILYFFLIVIL